MIATVPHVTSGLGLRKFQADGFLLTRVYLSSAFVVAPLEQTLGAFAFTDKIKEIPMTVAVPICTATHPTGLSESYSLCRLIY